MLIGDTTKPIITKEENGRTIYSIKDDKWKIRKQGKYRNGVFMTTRDSERHKFHNFDGYWLNDIILDNLLDDDLIIIKEDNLRNLKTSAKIRKEKWNKWNNYGEKQTILCLDYFDQI